MGWLSRLFGRRGERGAAEVPPRASAARAPAPTNGVGEPERGGVQKDPPLPEGAGTGERADPFETIWAAMNEGPSESPAPGPEADAVAELAPMLLEHFRWNRPDPASFPSMAVRVIDEVEKPDVEMNRLVQIIGQDPAISAKILRVANSVLYYHGTEVEDIRGAIMKIGMREVGQIAGGVAGRSLFDMEVRAEFDLFKQRWNDLFHNSMTVAFGAGALAMERSIGRSDRAFLAGMFHDIGKSIALRSLTRLIINGELEAEMKPPLVDALIEAVHVEIGGEMHDTWKMPQYLTVIAKRHHEPIVPPGPELAELHMVRVVSTLNDLRLGVAAEGSLSILQQSAEALKLDRYRLRSIFTRLDEHADRVTKLFAA